MAQKKAGGSSKNGRDSNSKKLGLKIFNNNYVNKGSIIYRQNGTKIFVGKNTILSRNYSIHSLINGIVKIKKIKKKTYINVLKCF